MTYAEKLKDPRWQKKRLLVLERDGFECVLCGDATSTLHVHHLKYTANPWESGENDLWTLCENCHREMEVLKGDAQLFLRSGAFRDVVRSWKHMEITAQLAVSALCKLL